MSQDTRNTVSFNLPKDNEEKVRSILRTIFQALEEKGYNPTNQMAGYMISGDPAYITSHKGARNLVCELDRYEIMEVLLKNYLLHLSD